MNADKTTARWLPIETAPKEKGIIVLLWNGDVSVGEYDVQGEWYGRCDGAYASESSYDAEIIRINNPTHWMPLPEPPL